MDHTIPAGDLLSVDVFNFSKTIFVFRTHNECFIPESEGMTTLIASSSSVQNSSWPDCSAFLNWRSGRPESVRDKALVIQSLVATVKFQPALDDSLEAKAVIFLKSVTPENQESADAFLSRFGRTVDESSTNFVQSIVVLLSPPSQAIVPAAMKMLGTLMDNCSAKVLLALVKADLIPQLIITLHPLSLSFAEAVDIHINLMKTICNSLWLATPFGLKQLEIEDDDKQQAVHETVLKQVLVPSEKYIWHSCMNRFSIVDGEQSKSFLILLARLLRISPYYQRAMDFVLNMPVIFTIPSVLTFFENETSILYFLYFMVDVQRKWNDQSGKVRPMRKKAHRMLRMEGIEDVIEAKLGNDQFTIGGDPVADSIKWNNLLAMNLLHRG
ncbi:hypothetical protein BLNAU_23616 [Blattamonas nauphoetae]|uniref:Uncharacterized protein n=1 Tax=Blattamonas nauphoetae TaxID=2049346 RepID=A0ABQ9WQS7_9EUKA|nr:hypothetical protein BLNAU_23616 [Blattamonas nauphoetae]